MSFSARLILALNGSALFSGLRAAPDLPGGARLFFASVGPIHRAFAPMAREGRFDISEMAIVTAIQALAYGRPIVLLPLALAARRQHHCLIRLASRPEVTAGSLRGGRIAVRAYSQTTGFWIRQILAEEHGLGAGDVTWVTQEEAHVPEYTDPLNVERVGAATLPELLCSGAADAAILGDDPPDGPEFAPVLPEPEAAAEAWSERHGIPMVNHVLVARRDVAERRARDLRAAYRALADATADDPLLPAGEAAFRPILAHVLPAMLAQGLLPRPMTVEEVLAPARAVLRG
jgi:4,5-dihydroxyphthalate decarboxylase